ncbi:unnamed protein product [Acanthoscelides obtectus]|uniref:WW domain-containing protein n=1 Tax=Acanthoscelides obtectus TaxID=200917 RepID=A0A9P0LW10_ACAOB|nr:unnamed protein product [Acanthoscelides obtectus]CAK1670337.1 Formin-binding protein 4 [Acanthoscelides obtectus]
MEYEVNDFFNEINEIAPPKQMVPKQETVWKQCQDELTGYTYYWNTKTDEVTWEPPASYKAASKKETPFPKELPPQKANLYIPPKTVTTQPPGAVKIYSIGECSQQTFKLSNDTAGGGSNKKKKVKTAKDRESVLKKFLGRDSESEDEKIELITSFGGDSDSENEEPVSKKNKHDHQESDHNEEDDDDLDILSQIKRAQALKDKSDNKKPKPLPKPVVKEGVTEKSTKNVPERTGLKLVAGYSDSEEDEPPESPIVKTTAFVQPESHSTLFPITKPIDIKDFAQPKTETEEKAPDQDDFIDAKAFQRKRRIGVALVNTAKKKEDVVDGDSERKGLGFSTNESQPPQQNSNVYPGFAKGGVMFVRSDVLQPAETVDDKIDKKEDEEKLVNKKEIEDMYQTLKEKLAFLNVDSDVVSPVLTIIIQAEILFSAMHEGGLKLSYLQKWLQNTCSDLIKLEKEAAPEGWLLQWDRS